MTRSLRNRKRPRRWRGFILCLLLFLTATVVVLYKIPSSLQDIGRAAQSAVGKIAHDPSKQVAAESFVRGTIYDRKWRELAVSYRLFSVLVNPTEIADRRKTAELLAPLIGDKAELVEAKLKNSQDVQLIAEDIDEKQAEQIKALQLRGVSCRAEAIRFYPGHTTASHVLGFMGDGIGVAGVEGKYDTMLQPGGFRKTSLPDIDFQGQESLGSNGTDLILTIDLDLQKQLENRLRSYLANQGAEKGMGLLIESGTGRILALVNQPSFNPNYFWKANESQRVNRMYHHVLNKELIRPILVRAAAIEREGLDGSGLLPPTVAAPNYGFSGEQLDAFERQIQLYGSVFSNWESGPAAPDQAETEPVVTGVQVGVTLASLVNGGWRITPYVVDAIYDHKTAKRYLHNSENGEKAHVLDPALGVKVRRDLFTNWTEEQENQVVFMASRSKVSKEKNNSRYSMQELFVGLAPAKQPKFLLLMATEQDYLRPLPNEKGSGMAALEAMGKELLTIFVKSQAVEAVAEKLPERNKENLRQFFITKRLNGRESVAGKSAEPVAVMPQMRGLSLRKGLQQIDKYKLKVRINGSGRIVAQYPLPGQPLLGVDECIVTLAPK